MSTLPTAARASDPLRGEVARKERAVAIPWTDSVKQKGQLSIYVGVLSGAWATVFGQALREFNTLSRAHKLGVTVTESDDAPTDSGGADVSVDTADGTISRTYARTTMSKPFNGKGLHGGTLLFSIEGFLEKAFIYLPSQPTMTGGSRVVGANVMKVIAVHELCHACGLENRDHTTDDLFQGSPAVMYGATAAQDKMVIVSQRNSRVMPPLILGGATSARIKDLWAK